MKLTRLAEALGARSLWDGWTDREVTGAYTSDLLSDVMANGDEGQLFITIQAHRNSVAVAVLKDMAAMLIAGDRPVDEDMLEAAKNENLPLLTVPYQQYDCSWKVRDALVSG